MIFTEAVTAAAAAASDMVARAVKARAYEAAQVGSNLGRALARGPRLESARGAVGRASREPVCACGAARAAPSHTQLRVLRTTNFVLT